MKQAGLAVDSRYFCVVTGPPGSTVSPEVIERAKTLAAQAPDVRDDRVSQAVSRMAAGEPDSHQLAEMILCRVFADSCV